jgi:hypothetical protein
MIIAQDPIGYHIPTWLSLIFIGLVLTASVAFSLKRAPATDTIDIGDDIPAAPGVHEAPHSTDR